MHLASESHVERSIDGPADFIQTNIVGAYTLLEATRSYWSGLNAKLRKAFRINHFSTDEVYGDLERVEGAIHRRDPVCPQLSLFGEQD